MAIRLSEAERAYFIRKLGGTNLGNKPLNQIKREYFAKYLGAGTATTPFKELEIQWILKVLATALITPIAGNYESDLWKQMVLSITQVPSKRTDQNKIIFYTNAT